MLNKKMLFLYSIAVIVLTSCVPKQPYEVKSPCVSIDSDDPHTITPCIRRPANRIYDIS